MAKVHIRTLVAVAALALAGCGGGSNSGTPDGTSPPPPQSTPDSGCTGSCANADSFLTQNDVRKVIAQAAAEAQAQGKPAVISVVDRVGNVLAVYKMVGAPITMTITSNRGVVGGLEGLKVPSELASIAKAVTGAYLSSEGNAFSTRTASQIVQEHFNPGNLGQPGGPLFGVQFSQLPCSDLSTHFLTDTGGTGIGPHNSPLGLSADPGGFPLYKNGTPVGGVGVAADGIYGLDPNVRDRDRDIDEMIALAGTYGFGAPTDRRGDTITVIGLLFRYSDVGYSDLASVPANAPPYSALANGQLMQVPFYADSKILDGTAFGQPPSGIEPDSTDYPGLDAFVLTDGHGHNRYPPIAGTDGDNALSANEVRTIVQQALTVANRARAQIRNPLGSQARVSVSVVDTNGVALAVARTRDAPIFGTDVSLQKARTASFNSGVYAAGILQSLDPVKYFADDVDVANSKVNLSIVGQTNIGDYVTNLRNFLGVPTALADGLAFTDRAGGNMARPFYPDGIDGNPNGPFSYPFAKWSPFQDGLQLDLVYNAIALNLVAYLQAAKLTVNLDGAALGPITAPTLCNNTRRLGNGIQVFPGSVPIYRGSTLVGGIGVSGDGVDQDDMVSFLGVHDAGVVLKGSIGNAPPSMRADNLAPLGAHLRYIQCPQAPFLDSKDENVCEGK